MSKEEIRKLINKESKKRTIKSIILIAIIGIVFGSIAGVTAYSFSAKQISFTPNDKTWKVNNVEDAITSLKNGTPSSNINYSTEEQVVGTWIDGKPIYQKTFNVGELPNASSKPVAHNISNYDKLVSISGGAQRLRDGATIPLPFVGTILNDMIRINVTTTNVNIVTGSDRTEWNGYITIQYTKTTDSAQSS